MCESASVRVRMCGNCASVYPFIGGLVILTLFVCTWQAVFIVAAVLCFFILMLPLLRRINADIKSQTRSLLLFLAEAFECIPQLKAAVVETITSTRFS